MTQLRPADIVGKQGLLPPEVLQYMVKVEPCDPGVKNASGFMRIYETLSRIGMSSVKDGDPNQRVLTQTCHIYRHQDAFYIAHFKHMFVLEGGENRIQAGDIARMNRIVNLLLEWGMVKLAEPEVDLTPACSLHTIKIVPAAQRAQWSFKRKYFVK